MTIVSLISKPNGTRNRLECKLVNENGETFNPTSGLDPIEAGYIYFDPYENDEISQEMLGEEIENVIC